MVRIITPGISPKYTNTCPHCMCTYEYEEADILYGYGLTTDSMGYIMCPYCGRRNNIQSRIPYNPYYEYTKIYCNNNEHCSCNCNYEKEEDEKVNDK